MPRLGLGLGLNLPRPIFIGGGGSPSVPVGALATYTAYSPSNFTLVTGDSINVWNDETTNANDLTQGTSGNQPVLVEDNTVTQFTASDQPTYDQVGAVDVMNFNGQKVLTGFTDFGALPNFAYRVIADIDDISGVNMLFNVDQSSSSRIRTQATNGRVRVYSSINSQFTTTDPLAVSTNPNQEIIVSKTGNVLNISVNGSAYQTFDVTGETFGGMVNFGSDAGLTEFNGKVKLIEMYSTGITDPTNPTETPTQTLTPDPTAMRTSANANPVLGEDVAKWYADEWSGYRDNHVLFDPVKYMEGLPAQASDFTYIFKYQDDGQATAGAIVSSNIDSSGISNVDGDTTELIAGDATSYSFDNTGATSYRMVAYLKSGNDVYNVTDYVTAPTQDATGKAFNLTSLGKATSGKDMKVKEFYLYDRELVGTDLDYFFYLRSETGEILLPPLLPS